MGTFFSSLIGGYANAALQREDQQHKEQMVDKQVRIKQLQEFMARPDFNPNSPEGQATFKQLQEVSGGKGKGGAGKGGGVDHIRTIFSKLRGQVPQQPGLNQPLAVSSGALMSPDQMAQQKGRAASVEQREKVQGVLRDIQDTDPGYWKQHPDQWSQVSVAAYGVKMPVPKGSIKVVADKNSPTGYSYGDFDSATNQSLGPLQPGAPAPASARPKSVTIRNGVITDENGKSYPIDSPDLPPEMKQMVSSYQKTKPYNTLAELKKEHPNWTPEQIADAAAKPSFPRIMAINDAQGNTIGYNYFQGTPGGGVKMTFMPPDAGGAPLPGGVIPPKPTGTSLTMQQMATVTEPELNRVSDEVDKTASALGPLAGRWNQVMVGKIGVDKPEVARLQMDLFLLASAVVRTHFGARGGQEYITSLENYYKLAQSPGDLKARIAASNEWITAYSKMAGQPPKTGASPTTAPKKAAKPATAQSGATVLMKTPDGKQWQVPRANVPAAKKRGATVVNQ